MFTFLILLLGIGQNHAASLIQNFTGSLDELGVCHCSSVLPDSTFPADRFEMLEMSNQNMTITVEQQINKIHQYESTLNSYTERLANLTKRVGVMETGGLSYTELDFDLLKLEIREMEALVLQLKSSMNGSNVQVEALYLEMRNLSIIVSQLEVYDKNNVMVIRRDIAALKKRLEDCEKNQTTKPTLYLPQMHNGTCQHGYIMNISKPFVVQLNYLGSSYMYGGWGRDSLPGANQDVQWVAPLSTDRRILYSYRIYNTYNDLLIYKHFTDNNTGSYGQGGGMIMFNKTMYFNCYDSRSICKNSQSNKVELSATLPNAAYNNRFSYSSSVYQDIDMASDEEDLWAIYSTEENAGNFVISKIDPISLVVKQTWTTAQYKPAATNAFMVCGVLYVTRAISTRREEIFYMYDTKTEKEGWLSIPLEKPKENIQSLSYNPNDHKLYMYNDGYLVNYDLNFKPPQNDKPEI
ncbi:olfactomedin-4-like [Bufo gargarizans]|uniref:olfactomedin-4-like n=1 Tax=Bufo gargarizans TaxID=30331 RepID=UPI001CF15F31|nr:olfactomedin-4-like [Bufo gargarizans]